MLLCKCDSYFTVLLKQSVPLFRGQERRGWFGGEKGREPGVTFWYGYEPKWEQGRAGARGTMPVQLGRLKSITSKGLPNITSLFFMIVLSGQDWSKSVILLH